MTQFATFKAIPKELFFDSVRVRKAIDRANRRALNQAGGTVRLTARRSMRYRKRASAPGTPPSAHRESGALLRRLLFYAYDPVRNSVVIGPVGGRAINPVPALHEFGGTVKQRRRKRGGRRGSKVRTVRYPARPFMGPALEQSRDAILDQWRASVI